MWPRKRTTNQQPIEKIAWNSLRTRILLFVLSVFLPIFGLILIAAEEQRRDDLAEAQHDAYNQTQLIASEYNQQIETTRKLLITLAHIPAVQEHDTPTCNALFADLLPEYANYTNFFAVNLQGETVCTGVQFSQEINTTGFVWFEGVKQTHGFAIAEFEIGLVSGLPVLTMGYPVYNSEGEFTAVVATSLSLNWLNEFVRKNPLPEGALVTIIDRDGTILARYPTTEGWVGQPYPNDEVREAAIKNISGTVHARAHTGELRLYGYTTLAAEYGNVTLIVGLPEEIALVDAETMENRNLAALGGVTLLVVLLAWLGSGLIMRPVNDLMTATRNLTAGQLSSRVSMNTNIAELKVLLTTFNTMAQSVERRVLERTAELSTTNERLRREIAEREQARQRTRILQELTAALSEAITREQVINVIVQKGLTPFSGSIYLIALHDQESNALRLLIHTGLNNTLTNLYQTIPLNAHVPLADVFQSGQPLWMEAEAEFQQFYPAFHQIMLKNEVMLQSFAVLPLEVGQTALGAMAVFFQEARTMDAEFRSLMQTISDYCAQALERVRLYEDERLARANAEAAQKRFAFLAEISAILSRSLDVQVILEHLVAAIVPELADWCFVNLELEGQTDSDTAAHIMPEKLTLLNKLKQKYQKTSQAQETVTLINDPATDITGEMIGLLRSLEVRSYMTVPMLARGYTLGTLVFGTSQSGRRYGDTDLVLVEELARRAALAIENAYLYATEQRVRQAAEWAADRIARLQRATVSLAQSLAAPEVAEIALDQMLSSLGASAGAIAIFQAEPQTLDLLHSIGYAPELILPWKQVALSHAALLRDLLYQGRPYWLEASPVKEIPYVPQNFQAAALLPLAIETRKLGLIALCFDEQRHFADEDKMFIMALVQNCAQAMERAFLHEEAQKVAALEERNRLARDLHDAVTQTLFSSSMISEALTRARTNPDTARPHLERLHRLNRGALAEMRNLLLELRPARLTEVSMKELLEQLAHAAMGRGEIVITVEVDCQISLPPDVQVALYRITQEAVNNVLKHAQAPSAAIRFIADKDRVELTVQDQGHGFDYKHVTFSGMGMTSMRERAEAIGAKLQVSSEPGKGTTVAVVWLPDPEMIASSQ